jgi:hypothetical protein
MYVIDVTDFMYASYSFPYGAQAVIEFLVENIGKQHEHCQTPFHFTGEGWTFVGDMKDSGTRWIVNIEDDTSAVLFKLKWL